MGRYLYATFPELAFKTHLCEVKTTHNRLLLPHCQGGTEFYLFKYNSMAYDSNQYPDGLPGFRETVDAYGWATVKMAQRLMPVVAAALGLSIEYFDAAFSDATAQLRCNHYPPVPGERRIGAHTDSSFMTFLPQVCMRAPGINRHTLLTERLCSSCPVVVMVG